MARGAAVAAVLPSSNTFCPERTMLQLPLRVKVEEDLGVGRGPPHLWAREEAIELRAQRLLDLRITPPQLADERPDARAIHHFVMPPQAGAGT